MTRLDLLAGWTLEDLDLSHTDNVPHRNLVDSESYSRISETFIRLCCQSSNASKMFTSPWFPSLPQINLLINLAVSHFLPSFPVFDIVTMEQRSFHWLAHLALATIGLRYLDNISQSHVSAMTEFLHRSYDHTCKEGSLRVDAFSVAQLLCVVAFSHHNSARLDQMIGSLVSNVKRAVTNDQAHQQEVMRSMQWTYATLWVRSTSISNL